jgi:hypothetical protein
MELRKKQTKPGGRAVRTEVAAQVYDAWTAVNTAITIAIDVGLDQEQFLDLVRSSWAGVIERNKERG